MTQEKIQSSTSLYTAVLTTLLAIFFSITTYFVKRSFESMDQNVKSLNAAVNILQNQTDLQNILLDMTLGKTDSNYIYYKKMRDTGKPWP